MVSGDHTIGEGDTSGLYNGNVLAIDPGTTESGWVVIDKDKNVLHSGVWDNQDLMKLFDTYVNYRPFNYQHVAIEMIASYGMPVGAEVFETCVWIGRFIQAQNDLITPLEKVKKVYRKDVKMFLCGTPRAKDANVRQALIDLYPATGGGKVGQIGTKSQPGPLYGLNSHIWPALGVALTALDEGF